MSQPAPVEITTPSDREIAMTRTFSASRDLVFRAWTEPDLLRRWLLGPPGWSMPVCEVDLRVGGAYRYVWRSKTDPSEISVGGIFQEIVPGEYLVHTESFEQSWYPGEAIVATRFTENAASTIVVSVMTYESKQARDTVLASPMESGVSESYARLDDVLEALTE